MVRQSLHARHRGPRQLLGAPPRPEWRGRGDRAAGLQAKDQPLEVAAPGEVVGLDARCRGGVGVLERDASPALRSEQDGPEREPVPRRARKAMVDEESRGEYQLQVGSVGVGGRAQEPGALGHRRGQGAAPGGQPLPHAPESLGPPQRHRLQAAVADPGDEMILEVLADPRQVGTDGDLVAPEGRARANPGTHQDLRRVHRTRAEDHLAGGDPFHRAGGMEDFHPGCPVPVERHPEHTGPGRDRQVGASPRRPEVGGCGALPFAATLGHMEEPHPLGGPVVEVIQHREAGGHRGIEPGPRDRARVAGQVDLHGATGPQVRAGSGAMVFRPTEERQDILPPPAGVALCLPGVVIGRLPAHPEHGVHGARPAKHPPARPVHAPSVEAVLGLGLQVPVGGPAEQAREGGRDPVGEGLPFAPCLEQQDLSARVGAEPMRQHAACRAGADDDHVRRPHGTGCAT